MTWLKFGFVFLSQIFPSKFPINFEKKNCEMIASIFENLSAGKNSIASTCQFATHSFDY